MDQQWRRAQRDLAPWEIEEMERYYAEKVASTADRQESMPYGGGYDSGLGQVPSPSRQPQPPVRRGVSPQQPMGGHSYALQPLPPLPQRVQERNYDHSFDWVAVLRGFLIALLVLVVVGGGGYLLRQWWVSARSAPRSLPSMAIPAAPAVVPMPGVAWEYKVIAPNDGDFLNTLNTLGSQGWQLISARRAMTQLDSGASQEVYEMILMRSLAPKK